MNIWSSNLGEFLALLTAVTWAIGVIFFKKSGETVHPLSLNLFKNLLAVILVIPTVMIMGESLTRSASTNDYLLLLISGALGIGIADTLFFKSLNLLGAGLSAVVDCLYSPFVIGMSMIWLGERLTFLQIIGVLLILSAVLTATHRKGSGHLSRRDLWLGLFYGALAMATTAVGIVIAKPLLNNSPLLWVTEIRLLGGIAVLITVLAFHPRRVAILSTLRNRQGWKYTLSGSFIGTYMALIFWLGGMKYTQASIAASLNQTSNIFIFIFAAVFLREPINRQRVIGIILGVAGAFIITFS
ncbi:MAG: DMT family transporter [FCB group bacterium]|nr:DMT family transporter [FCB group bacterium]